VKTKKLSVLISLVALIGTFTASLPLIVIEANDPNNNGKKDDITIKAFLDRGTAGDGNPAADGINQAIFTLLTPSGGIITDSGNPDPSNDPQVFRASFPDLADDIRGGEGTYRISVCFKIGFPEGNEQTRGFYHGEEGSQFVDTIAPDVTCQNLAPFTALETETQIPRGDIRLAAFFDNARATDADPNFVFDSEDPASSNAPDFFPVGATTGVIFTATDSMQNTGTSPECTVQIIRAFLPGCAGDAQFDSGTDGDTIRQICAELTLERAICGVRVATVPPTINYGTIDQGQPTDETNVSDPQQIVNLANDGNSPTDVTVLGTAWKITPPLPALPRDSMLVSRTHFSATDTSANFLSILAHYNSMTLMASFNPLLPDPLLIDDLFGLTNQDTFYRLQVVLIDPSDFGPMSQTITYTAGPCGSDVPLDELEVRND